MFADKLEQTIAKVPGAKAVILMGFDGIPVDFHGTDTALDIETIGMEFSVVLKEIRKAASLLEVGQTEEVMVRTGQIAALLRIINDDYFLVLALDADGNIGKGRYMLRLLGPQLSQELL